MTGRCRFCRMYEGERKWRHDCGRMVKYGVRHYAHHTCYLDAGKSLDDLHDWQIVEFPHYLLEDRGLDHIAIAAWKRLSHARSDGTPRP